MSGSKVKFYRSLGGKALLLAVVPTVSILFGIIIYTALSMSDEMREENESLLQNISEKVALEIERSNSHAVTVAQIMAYAQESGGLFGKRAESTEYARRILEESPEFTGACFGYEPNIDQNDAVFLKSNAGQKLAQALDKEGRFLPYWYRDQNNETKLLLAPLIDMETSLYYKGVKDSFLKSGSALPMVTEPYIYEGKMIMEQVYPIVIGKKFVGIAGIDRSLSDITDFIKEIKQREDVDIFLVSRLGKFIAVTTEQQADLITKAVIETNYGEVFKSLLESKDPSIKLNPDPIDGSRYYFASAFIPTGSWTVVLRKSENSIVAPIREIVVNNLILASLGVILVIGLSVWTSRSITRRVRSAVTAANTVAAGNLTADISGLQDLSQDEMGQLTDALNKMVESLKYKMQIINNISVGNYSLQAHPETEEDILGYALENMAENLKNVVAHAGLIAEGNYEQTLTPRSEHDELTISLNRMTQALFEVHNTLEQRVAELETMRNEAVLLAREADTANRSKSVFLANVSHEIRTPMNAITGFAEILNGQITDPQQKQYIAAIKTSGDSLLTLFSNILDMSRLEAGDLDLNGTDVDLLMVFTNIENIFEPKAAGKRVAFHLKLDPELPRSVELDEKRFFQILHNLLDNAVKFTKVGNISVEVKTVVTYNKVALCIDISDTGIGIPEDQIENVFAPFTQRQDQSINEYGGTGLGLTLTKRLLDAMGGRVTVTSEVYVGSTFHVVLDDVNVVDNTPIGDQTSPTPSDVSSGDSETKSAKPVEILTDAIRARLPDLLVEMAGRESDAETLSETLTINDVDDFAAWLKGLGDTCELPALTQWADGLAQQTSMFEMEGMADTLKSYPALLEEIRSLI